MVVVQYVKKQLSDISKGNEGGSDVEKDGLQLFGNIIPLHMFNDSITFCAEQ